MIGDNPSVMWKLLHHFLHLNPLAGVLIQQMGHSGYNWMFNIAAIFVGQLL